MHDNSIPTSRVITGALWTWVILVLLAAWIVFAVGYHELAAMLGLTACASSAAAATAQIRCYTLRVCALLRVTAGLDGGDAPTVQLHPLR